MIIERKIKINNRYYYLGIKLMYTKNKILRKADGSYFDDGDLSIMIDAVESSYEKESKECVYDNVISYMNDIIYLYDRFPFISYIKDISYNDSNIITCIGIINKEEIINYISDNNIKINKWDKSNSLCPLLYEQ